MTGTHDTPAQDAARREHLVADREADLAAMERRSAVAAPTDWQRAAHRLAAEVHAGAAQAHARSAALHELEASAQARHHG